MANIDNTLTDDEKQKGYVLLFNGGSLNGWHTYQNKPGSWVIEENAINLHKMENGQYADLVTNDQYENFELLIDWKMEPRANSGIMYLVSEVFEHSYLSGPEYQVLDDSAFIDRIKDNQKCAAVYEIKGPAAEAAKPVGGWNNAKIIVSNNHVEHWLNGKKVVEYELWSEDWKAAKAAGKWKDVDSYAAYNIGHIVLQDYHGEGKVWYKNIKLRKL